MYNDFKQTLRKIAVSGPEPREPYREFADSIRDEITAREFARMKEERQNYREYQKYLDAVGASEDPYQMPSTAALSSYGKTEFPAKKARGGNTRVPSNKVSRDNGTTRVHYNPGVEDMLSQDEALEADVRAKDTEARERASMEAARKRDAKKKVNREAIALRNQKPATTLGTLINDIPIVDTLNAIGSGVDFKTRFFGGADSKPSIIGQSWGQLKNVKPRDVIQYYKQVGDKVAAIPGRVSNAIKNSELGQTAAQLKNVTPNDYWNGMKAIGSSVSQGTKSAYDAIKSGGSKALKASKDGLAATIDTARGAYNALKPVGEKVSQGAKSAYDAAATGVVNSARWAGNQLRSAAAPAGSNGPGKPAPGTTTGPKGKKVTPSL